MARSSPRPWGAGVLLAAGMAVAFGGVADARPSQRLAQVEQKSDDDEPGAQTTNGDAPSGPARSAGAPPPAAAAPTVKKKKPSEVQYGVGLHLRAIFVHPWFLSLWLDASTPLNSAALGAEFVRRKGQLDIVGSIDYGFYSPKDGNYLGKGKDPALETDRIDFRGLGLLSFSVHFFYHHPITDWMSFVWGGGVGFGVVFGSIWRASNDPARCGTIAQARDESKCFPKGMNPDDPDEYFSRFPDDNNTTEDTPQNPRPFKEDSVWPVVPLVHLMVGLDFKINEHFGVRVDTGFRNAFYLGATGHYFF